jgi:hypothetical protein
VRSRGEVRPRLASRSKVMWGGVDRRRLGIATGVAMLFWMACHDGRGSRPLFCQRMSRSSSRTFSFLMAGTTHHQYQAVNPRIVVRQKRLPTLYRLLGNKEHAVQFMDGSIRLSTLSACRYAPDGSRRDPGEGTVRINADPPVVRYTDGLVLCATSSWPSPALIAGFGRYCIEIRQPHSLFMAITEALRKRYAIDYAILSHVRYVGRDFYNEYETPSHAGLLKPRDGYYGQREARMLWAIAEARTVHPRVIGIGDVREFCTLRVL